MAGLRRDRRCDRQSKNRSAFVGGLIGLLGGFIGIFILACLRKVEPVKVVRADQETLEGVIEGVN